VLFSDVERIERERKRGETALSTLRVASLKKHF
jgi:hypothetical protein